MTRSNNDSEEMLPYPANDSDWLTNVLKLETSPVTASSAAANAGTTLVDPPDWLHGPSSTLQPARKQGGPATTEQGSIIICPDPSNIPPGCQPSKILKCGISGCTTTTLFDRKFELERHMNTHLQGDFPCSVQGCCRQGIKAFTRADKLREQERKVHGTM